MHRCTRTQVHKYPITQVHKYTCTQVFKYKSIQVFKLTEIISCNIPICLNCWKITKIHKMTAVGWAVVGVTAIRNDLDF